MFDYDKGGDGLALYNTCGRCGCVIAYPNKHCDACLPDVAKDQVAMVRRSNRRYDQQRDKKYTRFYGTRDWRTLSSVYMQDKQYQCEQCSGIATEVHHVDPIQTDSGWLRRLDYDNLMAVCVDCHNEQHGRFVKKKRKYIPRRVK